MDIKQLRYFITVAQTLNFSEAARRNGLTQPAISHHINELEKQLNCSLFMRSRRSVIITEAGRHFLPYAIEMVETSEKAFFQVQQFEEGYKGSLTISALPTSAQSLCQCLKPFTEKWPNILIDVHVSSDRRQAVAMEDPHYSFYFSLADLVPHDGSFQIQTVRSMPLTLVLPKDHPLAGQPFDLSLLEKEKYWAVSSTDCSFLEQDVTRLSKEYNCSLNTVGRFDRAEAVVQAVSQGLGISILPQQMLEICNTDQITTVPIPPEMAGRNEVVVWRTDITNPAAQLFLSVLQDIYEISK